MNDGKIFPQAKDVTPNYYLDFNGDDMLHRIESIVNSFECKKKHHYAYIFNVWKYFLRFYKKDGQKDLFKMMIFLRN